MGHTIVYNWHSLKIKVKGYCVSLTSGPSECIAASWYGDPIKLFHDKGYNHAATKITIPSGFQDFEYCFAKDDIDIENDNFKFFATGTDAVCITSLHVDGKQIFFGKNDDLRSFKLKQPTERWPSICHDNNMGTPSLTIKNGEVIQSQCKGFSICIGSNVSEPVNNW